MFPYLYRNFNPCRPTYSTSNEQENNRQNVYDISTSLCFQGVAGAQKINGKFPLCLIKILHEFPANPKPIRNKLLHIKLQQKGKVH
jgi:hypothetical protein